MDRELAVVPSGSARLYTGAPDLRTRSIVFRYGVAVIATLVALVVKLALGPVIVPSVYTTFYAAVLVTAWLAGLGPGVCAALLSIAFGQELFMPPVSSQEGATQLAIVRDALFFVVAVGISWVTSALRASQRRVTEVLRAAQQALESRVAQRTFELRDANRRLTDEITRRSEAEKRFRNSFEYAPIGMALVSPDGRPLQINAALCRMLGYTRAELLHKPIAEVMHPDDLAIANADRARLLAGEIDSYQAERRYLHRSGSIVWVEMGVSLVRDYEGRPLNLVSHLHDITQRKHAEQALRESEAKFRTLAETMPVATFILQGPAMRYVNDAGTRITGYSRDELLAMPFRQLIHPDDRATARRYATARQAGMPVPPSYELMIVTKSGETRRVEFATGGIEFDGAPAVLGTAFDITERKRVEEALRHSEARLNDQAQWLQAILNSLGDAVVVADDKGKLLYFNPVAERLHGRGLADIALEDWSREYGVYYPDGTLTPSEDMPLARACRGVPTTANQEMAVRAHGQDVLIPVSVTATPLLSLDGALMGGVVVYRDISTVKEAERRLRRNEERLKEAERLAHVGAWEWDVTRNEAEWSDEQFRIFGWDPGSTVLTFDNFLQAIVPEDRDRVDAAVRDAIAGTRPFEVECCIRRPDGEIRNVYSRGEVVRDASGKAIRMLGTVVDVTERKRAESELERRVLERTAALRDEIRQREEAEAALRDSEERFRATFEQAAVGVCIVDAYGRWMLINDRLCAMLGYQRDELWQRTYPEITYHEDVARSAELVAELVGGQRDTFMVEKRYVRKDGTLLWGNLTASAVRDAKGAFKYGIAIVQDIDARRRAESERRAAEERLRRLVEHLPAVTYVLAPDERRTTLYISPQVESTLGFTPADWASDPRRWHRQLHPDDRDRVVAELAQCHATGAPFSSEYRMFTRDGRVLWLHDEAAVIRDERGTLLFSQGVMIDITARKQAEEELAATTARTRRILEEITDGFYTIDREGRFTYLNPSALRLLERSAEELLGKNVWEAFPEGIGSSFHEEYQRLINEGVPVRAESYYPPRNRWFRMHGYPMEQGACVLVDDVTERHEQEVAVMSDILATLNAHLDVAAAFPKVAESLRRLTGCERSSVTFFDSGGEWVRLLALDQDRAYLREGVRLRLADVPAAQDALAGRPHVVGNLATEYDFPAVRLLYDAGYRSRLSVPLQGRERVLGVLNLLWREVDAAAKAELPMVTQVAAMVALAVEKNELFDAVCAGRQRLEALSHRLLQVQEAERQHIARELHDEIGQALTALKLSLDTVANLRIDDVGGQLGDTRRQVDELLSRVRNLALDLRPAMLDDLGLLPALLWLFERYAAQTHVQVSFEHRGVEGRFNPEVETAAYRIVQEALTNAARYARVSQVTVRAWTDGNALSLQVIDEGEGFDVAAAMTRGASSGLAGMHERALLLGGSLAVESERSKGTRVCAEIPLSQPVAEERAWQ